MPRLGTARTPARPPAFVSAVAAAAVLAMAGCAAPATPWKVQPQYRIDHAAPAAPGQGYAALARRLAGEGRWRESLDAWRKAAAEAPDDVDILNALGMAEAGQGQLAAAIGALRRAVALAPGRVQLLNNLGYALMLDGQAEAALPLLRQALALDPRHALARENLARADQAAALALPVPPVAAVAPAAAATPPAPAGGATPVLRVLSAPDVPALEVASAPSLQRSERAALPAIAAPLAPVMNGPATLALMPAARPAPAPATPAPAQAAAPMPVVAAAPAEPAEPAGTTVTSATAGSATVASAAVAVADVSPRPASADAPAGAAARVEIANANGVPGLAAWTARWLRRQGQPGRARLVNMPPYGHEVTAVHYAPGWQAQARALAHRLPGSVALVADGAPRSPRADVQVVLGRDWRDIARCARCVPADAPTTVAGVPR